MPLACGTFVGLIASQLSNRLLKAFLFNIAPGSLLVSTGFLMLLLAVASFAVLFPAVRSTRIDVVDVLRYE